MARKIWQAAQSISHQIRVPCWTKFTGSTILSWNVVQPFPKTIEAGQAEHFCTVLWAVAHVLVAHIEGPPCHGSSLGQICIWLRLLWIPFLLTGIYSGEGNLKFRTWKRWETSAVIIASSQCEFIQSCNRARLISVPQPPQHMIYTESLFGGNVRCIHLGFLRCGAFNLTRSSVRMPATSSGASHRAELVTGFVLLCILLIWEWGSGHNVNCLIS